MSNKKKTRRWVQLRMLCCCGLDLMSLAPDAFGIAHDLVPNAASALFLTSPEGQQHATYHEDCPVEVQNLCADPGTLFDGPAELNLQRLVAGAGTPKCGQLLTPPPDYFSSNTYRLLVRGCGHHHALDSRLEVDGRPIGVIALFRESGIGFTAENLVDLSRIAHYLEHASKTNLPTEWETDDTTERQAMLVASPRGELLFASPAARSLLAEIPLAGSQWPDRRQLPPACRHLIDVLKADSPQAWQMPSCTLPLVGGALEVHAQWLVPPGDILADDPLSVAERGMVGIVLKPKMPLPLRVWRNLTEARLSPRQMEVAFWMAVGGGREAARARLSISEAVLRDCVKAVYEKLGCSSEADLVAKLRKA